jgi:uncharacterized membrane protein YcaP (DUF421 family)
MQKQTKLTQEEIKNLLTSEAFTLIDVVNAVIEINGIIGVGLISLAESLSHHIRSKI